MNIVTKEILEITDLELEDALLVREFIDDNNLIDWSEATHREIKDAIFFAIGAMERQ